VVEDHLDSLGSVRQLLAGGDVLFVPHVKRVLEQLDGCCLINGYGPTENTTFTTCYPMTDVSAPGSSVPIGRPIANTQVYILDAQLQPVPIGIAGELYTGGDGLARGYLNRPELTAEKFIPDPFSEDPAARFYKTGDLARYLPDGKIEFLGRIDHQVKIRGFRIELGEVESVLGRHPAVEEAVVIAREDVPGDKRLVAYVVASHEPTPTFSELRSFLEEKLPDYMIPAAFVPLDAMPLTDNGKVDRRALPAPDRMRPDLQEAFVAPRSQSEELVVGIWSNVLGLERIGVYDSFFELGGHSLLAVQIISRIREVFEVELPVRALFEAPTVAGLTERIEAARRNDEGLQTYPLQAVSRDQDLPLSFAQERLWFLHHLEPDSVAYSMPRSIRLKGVLRKDALQKTYVELARRHETLRTTFHSTAGNPVLRIAAEPNILFDTLDLRHLPEVEREAEVKRLSEEDARKPFDLRRGPLFRIRLFQLEDEEHVLHSNMHHIISDGWSFGVMAREIAALYTAFIKGKSADLPELPVQYADYAVWQRQWLQGEVLEAQLNHWKDKLGGELPVLELPTDRPRPAVQTHRGAIESLALSKELTDALQTISRREGVTLFMTLLAAFKTLLYRLTGQEEIIVGTPIANRNRVEIEGLIGFFVNSLVMRTDLSGNPTFRELLGRVRETALGAYANQDMPFEKLVEELSPERDLSRTPLFQVFFNHIVAMGDKAGGLPGLEAEAVGGLDGESKFDMTLNVLEGEGSIELHSSYNTDIFDSWRIAEMLKQYQILLESIVSDSDKRISELWLLAEAERHQILVDWNATAADYPEERCIHELFENQVEDTPDAIAVTFGKERLTYRELNTRANQLAHHLRLQGVVAESRVGIWMDRSLDMMVALLGTLKSGGAYVPMDPSYPQERLAFMLEDAQAPVLLTREKFLEDLPAYAGHVVCLDKDSEAIASGSEENPISNITPDSAAYVIYTSGSTGKPKGVIGLHRGAVNRLSWMWRDYPFKDAEVCCQKTHLSFVDSVWEIFGPLLKGVPAAIIPEEVVKDPHLLVDNLAAAHVSRIVLVPSLLRVLLDSFGDLQKRLFDLKIWITSGEEISVELAQRFRQVMPEAKLINLYGSSEVSADVSCYEVADGRLHRCIPIGRPIDNTSIYILDSHLQPISRI
jgi:amino acid adenylation domain-containing protein